MPRFVNGYTLLQYYSAGRPQASSPSSSSSSHILPAHHSPSGTVLQCWRHYFLRLLKSLICERLLYIDLWRLSPMYDFSEFSFDLALIVCYSLSRPTISLIFLFLCSGGGVHSIARLRSLFSSTLTQQHSVSSLPLLSLVFLSLISVSPSVLAE